MTFAKPEKSLADSIPHTPVKRTYRCTAHNCPMPGAIFGAGESAAGVCAYHYGAISHDWPRITQLLTDWQCVLDEITACRSAHNDPAMAMSPGKLEVQWRQAWVRLSPLVGTWADQLDPKAVRTRSGRTPDYHGWGLHLETFIGGRIAEQLSPRRRAA